MCLYNFIRLEKLYLQSFSWVILGIFARTCSSPNQHELLQYSFGQSKLLSLRTFSKEQFTQENLHSKFLSEIGGVLTSSQLCKLTKLLNWRDELARTQDESYEYILPDTLIREIVTNSPRDIDSLRFLCQQYATEMPNDQAETIFEIIQDEPSLQQKKVHSLKEFTERGADLISNLLTPNRESVSKLSQESENVCHDI